MKTSEQRMDDILKRADQKSAERAVRSKRIKIISITAVFLVFILAVNLVLFIPYNKSLPDLSRFADSQYYPLMQQLNPLTYRATSYDNNFDAWFGDMFDGFNSAAPEGGNTGAAEDPGAVDGGYVEVTDNQVAGVIEGDLFKRTSSHIFYLSDDGGYKISAYTIEGEDSALCGSLTINAEPRTYFRSGAEMYLSVDGDNITVFAPVWSYDYSRLYTAAIFVDSSDPQNMEEISRIYVSGEYISSRMAGEDLLLVSNFAVRINPDFSDESQFVPQYGALNDLKSLTMDEIILPESANSARYTVICRMGGDGTLKGHVAFLSFSDEVYVSDENIFVTRSYMQEQEVDGVSVSSARTRISCVSYSGDGLTVAGSADVNGTVLNQYSMDEREGALRVVTTVDKVVTEERGDGTISAALFDNAALYVVDLENFSVIASLENFAPDGEEVTSVRFEDDIAWVCTARIIELTDPVFRIDLSDYDNITYTDTGTISGYSSSLVDFTDGTLLGIGYNDDLDLKVEIYEQGEDGVLSVCKYEREAEFSDEYKAYFIDRQNGLVGLEVYDWTTGECQYILLHFDGYTIQPMLTIPFDRWNEISDLDVTRATLIDGRLYVISCRGGNPTLYVEQLPGLE